MAKIKLIRIGPITQPICCACFQRGTFQYGARLAVWFLEKSSEGDTLVTKLRRIEAALSLSRKLFRLGNSLDMAYKVLDSLSLTDQQLMVLGVTCNLFKALWLVLDHALWFSKIGVLQINQSVWSRWSLRVWLIALVAGTMADVRKLQIVKEKICRERENQRKSEDNTLSAPLQVELHNAQMNFYRDFCDMFIPLSGLNFVNMGWGAVCGVISSVIGFQLEWEKHIEPYKIMSSV